MTLLSNSWQGHFLLDLLNSRFAPIFNKSIHTNRPKFTGRLLQKILKQPQFLTPNNDNHVLELKVHEV